MKIALTISVIIAIFDSVITTRSEFTIESKTQHRNESETNTISKGATENLKQNVTWSPTLLHQRNTQELNVRNRLMPKMEIKDKLVDNSNSSYLTTTRRPLMRNKKFTSKPHAVHYIHYRSNGEQSNFSKRRNFNRSKVLTTQTKIKNILNTSSKPDSGEDRFINFTDIGAIDELGQSRRKVHTNRQLNRRRGYPLATAASQQFKSIAVNTLLNTDKVRSKSKLAIQESLTNIRRIRPALKDKIITNTDSASTKIKNNIVFFPRKNRTNIDTTLKPSIPIVITRDKSEFTTAVPETLVNSVTGSLPSLAITENPLYLKIIKYIDNSEIKSNKGDLFENTVERFIENKTDKLFISATTNGIIHNTEKSIHSTATKEKTDSLVKSVKLIHPGDLNETTDTVSKPITSMPLIIVTGKSITLLDINDKAKVINSNMTTSEKVVDPNELPVKKENNIIIVTPIPNADEVTTTDRVDQNSALRRKRRINIIEEERAPTTSTVFRFSQRETPISMDSTYRNIHV